LTYFSTLKTWAKYSPETSHEIQRPIQGYIPRETLHEVGRTTDLDSKTSVPILKQFGESTDSKRSSP
jgi:hypothetical protein